MRYGIALLVTALVVLSGFNFKVSSEDNSFQIITEGNYDIIYMENASLTHKTGYPMLPYKTKTYTFPLGTRIKDVKVVARNVQKIKLDKLQQYLDLESERTGTLLVFKFKLLATNQVDRFTPKLEVNQIPNNKERSCRGVCIKTRANHCV